MKLIREYINEKFTEESDPIQDLGIGMEVNLKKFIKELYANKYETSMKNMFENKDDLLWISTRHGKIELVKYLLNKGANIHHLSDRALRWAVKQKHYDIVKFLIDNGANVNAYDGSAFQLASDHNDKKMLDLLISYGAKPPTGDRDVVSEKFTKDSDPISDMGIGMMDFWKKAFKEKGKQSSFEGSEKYFNDDKHTDESYVIYLILKYIVEHNCGSPKLIKNALEDIIKDRLENPKNKIDRNALFKALKKYFYIDVSENIDEKFVEDSDPIQDLGIGSWSALKPGDILKCLKPCPRDSCGFTTTFTEGSYSAVIKKEMYANKLTLLLIPFDNKDSAIRCARSGSFDNSMYHTWKETEDISKWDEYFEIL